MISRLSFGKKWCFVTFFVKNVVVFLVSDTQCSKIHFNECELFLQGWKWVALEMFRARRIVLIVKDLVSRVHPRISNWARILSLNTLTMVGVHWLWGVPRDKKCRESYYSLQESTTLWILHPKSGFLTCYMLETTGF